MLCGNRIALCLVLLLVGAVSLCLCAQDNPVRDQIEEPRQRAESGDAAAQFALGWRYAHGDGLLQDYAQAALWYRKAADQGHPAAQFHLGWYYAQGLVVPRDPVQAVTWYQRAASKGNPDAQVALANCYSQGHGVERDPAVAAFWFAKAARQGDAGAQFSLGMIYLTGQGLPKNELDAYVWFSLAAAQAQHEATEQRDQVATRLSGDLIEEGKRRVAAFVPVPHTEADAVPIEPEAVDKE